MAQQDRQKIITFVGKDVGLRLTEYLLDTFPHDLYTFVICKPNEKEIAALLEKYNASYVHCSPKSLKKLFSDRHTNFDWLLNLWGGHIFKPHELLTCKNSLNIHPSYLPYARGRDPIVWTIRHEYPAGVTLHQIAENIDAGPIWYQEEISYSLPCHGKHLYSKVIKRCWEVFIEQWPTIRSAKTPPTLQDSSLPNHTARRKELYDNRVTDLNKNVMLRQFFLDIFTQQKTHVILNNKPYKINFLINKPLPDNLDTQKTSNIDTEIDQTTTRIINLDTQNELRNFILTILAQDFSPEHSAQALLNDQIYNITLKIITQP